MVVATALTTTTMAHGNATLSLPARLVAYPGPPSSPCSPASTSPTSPASPSPSPSSPPPTSPTSGFPPSRHPSVAQYSNPLIWNYTLSLLLCSFNTMLIGALPLALTYAPCTLLFASIAKCWSTSPTSPSGPSSISPSARPWKQASSTPLSPMPRATACQTLYSHALDYALIGALACHLAMTSCAFLGVGDAHFGAEGGSKWTWAGFGVVVFVFEHIRLRCFVSLLAARCDADAHRRRLLCVIEPAAAIHSDFNCVDRIVQALGADQRWHHTNDFCIIAVMLSLVGAITRAACRHIQQG